MDGLSMETVARDGHFQIFPLKFLWVLYLRTQNYKLSGGNENTYVGFICGNAPAQ